MYTSTTKPEHIQSIDGGWNSGGHILLDIIYLKTGQVILVGDDGMTVYPDVDSFDNYQENQIEIRFDDDGQVYCRDMKNFTPNQVFATDDIGTDDVMWCTGDDLNGGE